MNSKSRFVFDTNVLISALLFCDSIPGRAFASALSDGAILISGLLVEELNEVFAEDSGCVFHSTVKYPGNCLKLKAKRSFMSNGECNSNGPANVRCVLAPHGSHGAIAKRV